MNNSLSPREMTSLNGAAFRIGPEAFLDGWLEWLLDVLGGATESSACTEFNCNVYAPPPPKPGG